MVQDEKISIVVPIYNVEKYLEECLESIVNQTYKNLEIILVDDGSPDNCPQICETWAKKDNRIKVLHKPNGGLMAAWVDGFKISTGEYIAFVDSDDYIEKDFVKVLYESLKANGAEISICDYFEDREGVKIPMPELSEPGIFCKTQDFNCVELYSSKYKLVHSRINKLYKRNIIEKCIKYLNPSVTMGEDLNLTFCALCLANAVSYVNKGLYAYRILNSSMSHIQKNSWKSYSSLIKSLAAFIKEENIESTGAKKVFYSYVHTFFYYTASYFYKNKLKKEFKEWLNNDLLKNYYWGVEPQSNRHKLFQWLYKRKLFGVMYFFMKF